MKWMNGSVTQRALMVGLLAGSGLVAASAFAMPAGGPEGKGGCETRHGQQAHGKWEEHRSERLSALKEKLKLQPGQEAAWNAFASTRKTAQHPTRDDRAARRSKFARLNTLQRLDMLQARSDQRHARMVERTQAIRTFYAQLSPEQQSVFDAETMPGRHHGHHNHRQQS